MDNRLSWISFFSMLVAAQLLNAADWDSQPIPANPGLGMGWTLDNMASDQFNYQTSTSAGRTEFDSRWRDSKPDGWLGPGATYFSPNNYFVNSGVLTLFGSRVPLSQQITNASEPQFTRNTFTSYITSDTFLNPGVYTEVRMKGGGTSLSSNFWLLDDGNEAEIDVVEVYGDTDWFRKHPSTNVHFFKRDGSGGGDINNQDHHPSNSINFAQTWHTYGVHWESETLLSYYYDGQLVRTLDLTNEIIDPSGQYLNEPLRLILDLEAHSWRGKESLPTDAELADWTINNMQVDWVRTYQQTALLAGDYNNDGFVDAADYAVWRDGMGGPAGTLLNDVDGGVIGQAQYDTWAANFGASTTASTTAVPEPGTGFLFVMSVACGVLGLNRNRRDGRSSEGSA